MFSLSCDQQNDLANTIWIGDHSCHRYDQSKKYDCDNALNLVRKILIFSEDSIKVWHTYSEFVIDDDFKNNRSYRPTQIGINTVDLTNRNELKVEQNGNRITFIDSSSSTISTYRSLPTFEQGTKMESLEQLLISNAFIGKDSFQYEFNKINQVITPSLWDDPANRWELDTVGNELFLLTGGIYGSLMHVKEISDSSFVILNYHKGDNEYSFNTIKKEDINEINLIGSWKSQERYIEPSRSIFYGEELLTFQNDHILIVNYGDNIDTLSYNLNRTNSIMYIVNPLTQSTAQWNIVNSDSTALTIERKGLLGYKTDTITYFRM